MHTQWSDHFNCIAILYFHVFISCCIYMLHWLLFLPGGGLNDNINIYISLSDSVNYSIRHTGKCSVRVAIFFLHLVQICPHKVCSIFAVVS